MGREELFKFLLRESSGTYVEIGTCWGGFAEFLLLQTPVKKLICVDPYKQFPQEVYKDALNTIPQDELNKKYEIVLNRLKTKASQTNKSVQIVRDTSYEAAKLVEDNLDFVYIDGNHHHREVLKDLICWWPKIKKGGLLCGDDVEDIKLPHTDGDLFFEHQPGSFGVYGVATALRDFAKCVPDFRYMIDGNQFYAYKN